MQRRIRAGLHRLRGRLGRRLPSSLGAKLVLILSGIGLVGAAAIALLMMGIITPGFDRLEQAAAVDHVERTRVALHDTASKVEKSVRDYGDWNSSYDYMARPTRAFEEESFSPLAMVNLDVNGMAYIGNDRRIVIARWLDLDREQPVEAMRRELERAIDRIDLARLTARESSANFYLRLGNSLTAVAVAQVRRSDGTGAPRGYVLMARTIGSDQLSNLLQLKARIDLARPVSEVAVVPRGSRLDIAVPILGPDARPVATAAYSVPRDLWRLGERMLLFTVLGSTLLLAVVLLVLRRMISRLVLKPLNRVERHMGVVRQSGALSLLTEQPRGDEIGSLVTSFNSMLRQLKDLREQLEVQSFKLGRSESAVAVMHNVRNALNPISTILSQGLGAAPVDQALIDRALGELIRGDIPEVRRQKLVAFLAATLQSVADERARRQEQLEIGRTALHHVLEIIGQQQEAAHERPQLETCDITDIIAQNATIARYSGENSIVFSFPSRPHWVLANRVILSQVVGNLLANAGEAIAATGRHNGSIHVTVERRDDCVEVVVRDDGEGFDPDAMPKLFQRGFSTREHKSGGLGLHWCANSMVAMQGTLQLASDGRGTGARAVLKLQPAPAMEAAEAA